ncbi:MAG TPA: DUF3842 family protein [bacterium]|jgi:hypothetical protein|nr:DUF3842 family protein [bacterium]
MLIVVIDGLGGGIGCQLIGQIKSNLSPAAEVLALGTNSIATQAMIKAGAHRGATGENAIRLMAAEADVILGPLGIILPNAMMGEITSSMAKAVVASPAKKLLLPVAQPHVELVGLAAQSLATLIRLAGQRLAQIERELK